MKKIRGHAKHFDHDGGQMKTPSIIKYYLWFVIAAILFCIVYEYVGNLTNP